MTQVQYTGYTNDLDRKNDFAFLKLQKPLGKKNGYMSVIRKAPENFRAGSKFEVIGFNGDIKDGKKLTADKTARILKSEDNEKLLYLVADTFRGASGGPVIAYADNGVPYIAGVNSAGYVAIKNGAISQEFLPTENITSYEAAKAVPTNNFYEQLVKFMKDHPCE